MRKLSNLPPPIPLAPPPRPLHNLANLQFEAEVTIKALYTLGSHFQILCDAAKFHADESELVADIRPFFYEGECED